MDAENCQLVLGKPFECLIPKIDTQWLFLGNSN
jgi:hypothetical protein